MSGRSFAVSALVLALAAPLAAVSAPVLLPEGSPAHLTAQGNEALMRGQFDTALGLFDRALEEDRHYFFALYNKALTFQHMGEAADEAERRRLWADARHYYQQAQAAMRGQEEHAEIHCNLGFLAFRSGEYRQAADHFAIAAERARRPHLVAEYAFNLGTAMERLESWREAQEAYERAIAHEQEHFGAHFNLGTLFLKRLGNPARAEVLLLRARELQPRRPEPALNLAVLAEQREQPSKADSFYSEAVTLASRHRTELLNTALWQRARFYDRAEIPGVPSKRRMRDDLIALLERAPDFPGANGLLGIYYTGVADYPRAVEHLEREVAGELPTGATLSELRLKAHYHLATIYTEHLRNPAKALDHATSYYAASPGRIGRALLRRAKTHSSGAASND